jgi:hypothetical protein
MKFNNITGVINEVPLATYDKLISSYVNIVKKVKGVKSIVQIGSFTAPGLSDIDLILIVDDFEPPNWDEISIKKILKGQIGYEVIAHDIFVYPESLSDFIEGLFYLDQKKVLFGNDFGNKLSEDKINELKLILTFEYSVHRLETLVILTSLQDIAIRDILLFISTLRHTYILLNHFNIISVKECNSRIEQIESLRTLSINNDSSNFKNELNNWIIPCFESIFNSALLLGEKLGYISKKHSKSWILNSNKLIFNFHTTENAVEFFTRSHYLNKKFKAKILIESMPNQIIEHISNYHPKNQVNHQVLKQMSAIQLRYNLAVLHEKFIIKNCYPIAKSYIIISSQEKNFKNIIKISILKLLKYFVSVRRYV